MRGVPEGNDASEVVQTSSSAHMGCCCNSSPTINISLREFERVKSKVQVKEDQSFVPVGLLALGAKFVSAVHP